MQWRQVLSDAGLSDREVNAVMVLSTKPSLKASELAKELGTTRLDAYNSLERLQSIGLVKTIADRPMRFSCPRSRSSVPPDQHSKRPIEKNRDRLRGPKEVS